MLIFVHKMFTIHLDVITLQVKKNMLYYMGAVENSGEKTHLVSFLPNQYLRED